MDFRPIADKIVGTCLGIRPGEVVQIGGGIHNFAFVGALAAAVRRAGAFAELNVTSDDLQLETLTTVPVEYLQMVPRHRLKWLDDVDAMIVTDAVADPRRAAAVPQDRLRAAQAAAEAVQRHILERGVRWLYVPFPTPAARAGLPITFDNLWSMFWRAVDVDYEALQQEAAALAAALEAARDIRLVSDNGTDLTLSLGDRPVLVDDGVMSEADMAQGDTAINLPAGEVFVRAGGGVHPRAAGGGLCLPQRPGHAGCGADRGKGPRPRGGRPPARRLRFPGRRWPWAWATPMSSASWASASTRAWTGFAGTGPPTRSGGGRSIWALGKTAISAAPTRPTCTGTCLWSGPRCWWTAGPSSKPAPCACKAPCTAQRSGSRTKTGTRQGARRLSVFV